MRIRQHLESLTQDVRYAFRGFHRSPGFTLTVVLMLAVAIGANTAIFSLADRLLLRHLPYPESGQVVMVYETFPNTARNSVSPANWMDWQRMSKSFEALAAWALVSQPLTGEGEPELLNGQMTSAEFFPALGVKPMFGRVFAPEEDRPNAPRVVVLSYNLWQRRFGSDYGVIGKKIELDAVRREVIGVMPPDFYFMNPMSEYWIPWALNRQVNYRATGARIIPAIVGRLKSGVTVTQAQAEMRTVAAQLEQSYPMNKNNYAAVVPLRDVLTDEVRPSLFVLMAAVTALLMIACFNVASMMLARSASRQREIAVRVSLGASRGALVRQLIVESLLLAAIGGAAGFLVATWAVSGLLEITPRNLIRVPEVPLDARVLLYTLALSALTGLAFGLAPALSASRGALARHLHGIGRTITRAGRARQWLVAAQVAVTVVLLCGAGLLVRSFGALNSAPTGVQASDVLTMQFTMPDARYDADKQVDFVQQIIGRVEMLPGVESAAATRSLPVIGPTSGTVVDFADAPEVAMQDRPSTRVRIATPGYFKTVGVPLVQGRDFTWDDQRPNAELVFIVNEAFVKARLSGRDPLSTRMRVLIARENPFGRIVGVVADVREGALRQQPQPTVFYNQRQLSYAGMTLFVRTATPSAMGPQVVSIFHELDPNLTVTQVRTLQQAFGLSILREKLNATVTAAFAITALLLASLGLYGVLAFVVSERTREIGIRMALGAQAATVLRMVMQRGFAMVAYGAFAGLIGAFAASRWLGSLLYEIRPSDPTTFLGVAVLLLAVTAIAAFVPARRATQVDPVIALRQD